MQKSIKFNKPLDCIYFYPRDQALIQHISLIIKVYVIEFTKIIVNEVIFHSYMFLVLNC